MFKIMISFFIALLSLSSLHAMDSAKGHYYVIPKALVIEGEPNNHDGLALAGDIGYGFGVDIGYSFAEHFAVEFATSYATNDVKESTNIIEGMYITYGIDLAYTHHFTEHFGILLKSGYGFEYEKVEAASIEETANGLTMAVGLEYGMSKRTEFVVELEKEFVHSTRGTGLFVGVKYKM
jgi:hypothetical protein